LPGIFTGLASLIAAVTGLYVATDGFHFKQAKQIEQQQESQQPNLSEEEHKRQLASLKRQQEIDEIRLSQEKTRLLAEQELAELKAKKRQIESVVTDSKREPTAKIQSVISGNWSFTNLVGTYIFSIRQEGSNLTLQEFDSYGNNVGSGWGKIEGRDVYLNWVEPYLFVMSLEVEANLTLGANGYNLIGTMYADGNAIPMSLIKQ
jgi:glucan-binding YG repeat protein